MASLYAVSETLPMASTDPNDPTFQVLAFGGGFAIIGALLTMVGRSRAIRTVVNSPENQKAIDDRIQHKKSNEDMVLSLRFDAIASALSRIETNLEKQGTEIRNLQLGAAESGSLHD